MTIPRDGVYKILSYVSLSILLLGMASILVLGFCYNFPICKDDTKTAMIKCITIEYKNKLKEAMIITGCIDILLLLSICFVVYKYYNKKDVDSRESDEDQLLINGLPYGHY